MTICAVIGCSNRSSRRNPSSPSVGFYCLPKVISNQCERTRELSERRRRMWLDKINRRELYFKKDVRICSLHFVSGKPAYLMHDNHPDWLPTLKLGRDNRSKSFHSQRVKQEQAMDNREAEGNSQAADERSSGNGNVASKKTAARSRTAGNGQVTSTKKVAGNGRVAGNRKVSRRTQIASNMRVASTKKDTGNWRAASTKKGAGNRSVASSKKVAEDQTVADNKEAAAQGLLELAGIRTREETGLSAVREWLKLNDGGVDVEHETGVATQTTLKMQDIIALELELRNLRRQLRDLREKKPASSSG